VKFVHLEIDLEELVDDVQHSWKKFNLKLTRLVGKMSNGVFAALNVIAPLHKTICNLQAESGKMDENDIRPKN